MLKTAFLVLFTLVIAIGGGAASVWYALDARAGVGAVTIGGWTAYPDMGTPDSDPYSKARVAREGVLALGPAEGLTFTAQRDSSGQRLRRQCNYRIEGDVPSARFWTLHASDDAGAVIGSDKPRPAALHSYNAIRAADNSISVAVGPHPAPGNWLALSGSGPMSFVLTLYDTTIATSTELDDIALPQLRKVGCDA